MNNDLNNMFNKLSVSDKSYIIVMTHVSQNIYTLESPNKIYHIDSNTLGSLEFFDEIFDYNTIGYPFKIECPKIKYFDEALEIIVDYSIFFSQITACQSSKHTLYKKIWDSKFKDINKNIIMDILVLCNFLG